MADEDISRDYNSGKKKKCKLKSRIGVLVQIRDRAPLFFGLTSVHIHIKAEDQLTAFHQCEYGK